MERAKGNASLPTQKNLQESCARLRARLECVEAFFDVYPNAKDEFMRWLEDIDDSGNGVESLDALEIHAAREYFAMGE